MPKQSKKKVGKDDKKVADAAPLTPTPQEESVKEKSSSEQDNNETLNSICTQEEQVKNEQDMATTEKEQSAQDEIKSGGNDDDKAPPSDSMYSDAAKDDDEDEDEDEDEEGEAWDLRKVLTAEQITGECVMCDTQGCDLLAAVIYISTGKKPQKWRGCLDCQVRIYCFPFSWLILFSLTFSLYVYPTGG